MKTTINFTVDFFGEPIYMSFEKEALKQDYDYCNYYLTEIKEKPIITIRQFIRTRIAIRMSDLFKSTYL